tara:strand:- start:485 stop:961 length:477 start_codon:yes stop_codon:yes gene_type:complete
MTEHIEIPELDLGGYDEEKKSLERLIPEGLYDLQFKGYEYSEERGQVMFEFVVVNHDEAEWNGFPIRHRPYLTDFDNRSLPSKAYKSTILAVCADQIKEAAESGARFLLSPDDLASGQAQPLVNSVGVIVKASIAVNEWENAESGRSGRNNKITRFEL